MWWLLAGARLAFRGGRLGGNVQGQVNEFYREALSGKGRYDKVRPPRLRTLQQEHNVSHTYRQYREWTLITTPKPPTQEAHREQHPQRKRLRHLSGRLTQTQLPWWKLEGNHQPPSQRAPRAHLRTLQQRRSN